MVKKLDTKLQNEILYICSSNDTLSSIAQNFGISEQSILRDNPLFLDVYEGCALYLTGLGKIRVDVKPLQTLEDIASEYNLTVDEIMKQNQLKSRKIFVGMQLYIDKKGE